MMQVTDSEFETVTLAESLNSFKMKYLFTIALAAMMSFSMESVAQDALYSKEQFEKILQSHNEVIVLINGFEYKYTGSWLTTMEIVNEHTLTFARGRVVHSYDLSKVVMVQEEGGWVKLWLK